MGPLVSLLFSNRVRPVLRVVTMTVFVNEMLLMIAGDVERNPGPGKYIIFHVVNQPHTPLYYSILLSYISLLQ